MRSHVHSPLRVFLATISSSKWRQIPGPFAAILVAILAPAAGITLRVMMGRHFASDTLFAAIFVAALALVLSPLFFRRERQS